MGFFLVSFLFLLNIITDSSFVLNSYHQKLLASNEVLNVFYICSKFELY
jgi:hypothetical protein